MTSPGVAGVFSMSHAALLSMGGSLHAPKASCACSNVRRIPCARWTALATGQTARQPGAALSQHNGFQGSRLATHLGATTAWNTACLVPNCVHVCKVFHACCHAGQQWRARQQGVSGCGMRRLQVCIVDASSARCNVARKRTLLAGIKRSAHTSSLACTAQVYASFFGVGAPEAVLVGIVALVIFGPQGLAEVGIPVEPSSVQTSTFCNQSICELNSCLHTGGQDSG